MSWHSKEAWCSLADLRPYNPGSYNEFKFFVKKIGVENLAKMLLLVCEEEE